MRKIPFKQAVGEATAQAMERDPDVFMMGVGIDEPKGIFGTTIEPVKKFGPERAFDCPISENALTGAAVGAAMAGMRPILVHARMDFLMLTMDQLVNHAAKWRYMSGGKLATPIVVRAVVGKGWGQAAQHSQNLHALLAHVPGINVAAPSCAYDAKGLLAEALYIDTPTVFVEHRTLHETVSEVPEEWYRVAFGSSIVRRSGADLTIVAFGHMVGEALKAADALKKRCICADVIDLRTVSPWDKQAVLASVRRSGRMLALDASWKSFGVAAEICATVADEAFSALKAPPRRVALPDVPTPCSSVLEKVYYPDAAMVAMEALGLFQDDFGHSKLEIAQSVLEALGLDPAQATATASGIRGPF